jgi:hypothetical protein
VRCLGCAQPSLPSTHLAGPHEPRGQPGHAAGRRRPPYGCGWAHVWSDARTSRVYGRRAVAVLVPASCRGASLQPGEGCAVVLGHPLGAFNALAGVVVGQGSNVVASHLVEGGVQKPCAWHLELAALPVVSSRGRKGTCVGLAEAPERLVLVGGRDTHDWERQEKSSLYRSGGHASPAAAMAPGAPHRAPTAGGSVPRFDASPSYNLRLEVCKPVSSLRSPRYHSGRPALLPCNHDNHRAFPSGGRTAAWREARTIPGARRTETARPRSVLRLLLK